MTELRALISAAQLQTNQDLVNHFYAQSDNTWDGAARLARQYTVNGVPLTLDRLVADRRARLAEWVPPPAGSPHSPAEALQPPTNAGLTLPPRRPDVLREVAAREALRTNQDMINYLYSEGGGGWDEAAALAERYGLNLNRLVRDRSGALEVGEPTAPPAVPGPPEVPVGPGVLDEHAHPAAESAAAPALVTDIEGLDVFDADADSPRLPDGDVAPARREAPQAPPPPRVGEPATVPAGEPPSPSEIDLAHAVSPDDGVVDAEEVAPLRPPVLQQGDNDVPGGIAWIHDAQLRIREALDGDFGPIDGIFGGGTRRGVQRVQLAYNEANPDTPIRTDGVLDGPTWDALPPRPLREEPTNLLGPLGDPDNPLGTFGLVPYEGEVSLNPFESLVESGALDHGATERRAIDQAFFAELIGVAPESEQARLREIAASAEGEAAVVAVLDAAPTASRPAMVDVAVAVLGGQALLDEIERTPDAGRREEIIINAALAGNVPSHMREFVPVTINRHGVEVVFYTLPDGLSLGSDDDYAAMPMWRVSAELLSDRLGTMLPTSQMVDDRWMYADYRFDPYPLGGPATSDITAYRRHNALVQRAGTEGALVAGVGKTYINDLRTQRDPSSEMGQYGWTEPSGRVIQQSNRFHTPRYADYSLLLTLYGRTVEVNGVRYRAGDIIAHPELYRLLSRERLTGDLD